MRPGVDALSTSRSVTLAFLAAICSVLPPFLVGAQAVQIGDDLHLTTARLGTLLSLFFVTTTISARFAGAAVDRLGWSRSMLLVAGMSTVVLLTVAATARSTVTLAVLLALGGTVNAVAMPAVNLLLHREVVAGRQGLTFGITQAAIPAAGILAGAAVPLLAVRAGWRWSFAAAAAVPLAVAVLTPVRRDPRPSEVPSAPVTERPAHGRPFALTGGIGAAVVAILSTFFVTSVVERGIEPGTAGLLLVAGSVVGVTVRIVSGWVSDRRGAPDALRVVAWLFAAGAAGFVLLTQEAELLLLSGTVLAFGGGWGWPALFHLALVRARPHAPATATGAAMFGMSLGAAAGPVAFGWVVSASSMQAAWGATAALSVLAAALVRRGGPQAVGSTT